MVVALSRLVHRKGIDLLAVVVGKMCRRRPDLCFVIGTPDGILLPLHVISLGMFRCQQRRASPRHETPCDEV